jgi:hypothetical protein
MLEVPVVALGDPDVAHASATEERHKDVVADSLTGPAGAAILDARGVRRRTRLQKAAGVRVRGEEISHESRELRVAGSKGVQARRRLGR